MKKLFVIISALFALAACDGINAVDETGVLEEGTKEFKIALTVNRTDAFDKGPGTKATIKNAWADGDVVFVFFNGVAAPKYLELKYDATTRNWTPTPKNELSVADLGASGKMTAVYMPYGSSAEVFKIMSNTSTFSKGYYGVYLQASKVDYTYDSDGLKGTLNLAAPIREDGSKYIHFDISGYDAKHVYSLYQDYVKPIALYGVKKDGEILEDAFMENGEPITGYIDAANSIISFSGILDENAVGQAVDYQFSIKDETAGVIYTRDAGTRTVSDSKYIGIGNISDETVWQAKAVAPTIAYVEMGDGLKWATMNIGANSPEEYGDYFAWAEIETKTVFSWATYKYMQEGQSSWQYVTKYNDADGKTSLRDYEYSDDVARQKWGDGWRLPTDEEWTKLRNWDNFTWEWTYNYNGTDVAGTVITSRISGYEGNSIFLPAAGYKKNTESNEVGSHGYYWSSTIYVSYMSYNLDFYNAQRSRVSNYRYYGMPVRAVICDNDPEITSINGHEYVDLGNGLKWATTNVGANSPEKPGSYYAWGEIAPKNEYRWTNYVHRDPSYSEDNGLSLTKYTFDDGVKGGSWYEGDTFIGDGKTTLDLADDVARQNWGGTWRMPTAAEFGWLVSNCTWSWSSDYSETGVAGMVVTGTNGKSIFLPAAGRKEANNTWEDNKGLYWSSSLGNFWSLAARVLSFYLYDGSIIDKRDDQYFDRFNGLLIRPVSD